MENIGVIFGGVSVEHEVSVISALQAIAAMDRTKYRPIPIYIAKSGTWYTADFLLDIASYQDVKAVEKKARRVHLVQTALGHPILEETGEIPFWRRRQHWPLAALFIALHGADGENGSVQGLCEVMGLPYTGSGVLSSAVGMDKVITKMLCRDQGVPVVDFVAVHQTQWEGHEEQFLDQCEANLGYPMIVKPARLGSSIGIAKVKDRKTLDEAIETAFRYDHKVLIEKAVTALREINCAVLGQGHAPVASILEEPVQGAAEAILTFADKYQRGGNQGKNGGTKSTQSAGMAALDRHIPALLSEAQTARIRQMAVQVFTLLECAGVARLDFLLDAETNEVYFNEINTVPGSFAFYLWERSDPPLSFSALVDQLIEIAKQQQQIKNQKVRSYDTNLLAQQGLRGLKGKGG